MIKASFATECFPASNSLLPKIIDYTSDDNNYDERIDAIAGT